MQVSQQISPISQPLSIAFTALTTLTRDFFTQHSLLTLNPALPGLYSELALAVDQFCRQLGHVPIGRAFCHRGNPLYDQAHLLTGKWLEFLCRVDELGATDISPYLGKGMRHFTDLEKAITRLATAVGRSQFLSHRVAGVLSGLLRGVGRCRGQFARLFEAPTGAAVDVSECEEGVSGLLARSRFVFETEIPVDAIPIRERLRYRTAMLNACAAVLEVLQAVGRFHAQIARIKGQIGAVNRQLTAIYVGVGLPFTVTSSNGLPKAEL
jgi:hypothetical protein